MLGSQQIRRYCRYCGSSVTPNDAFCSSCGERLASREGIA
ncbi:MAG: zinc-ribbon domain-containing protein [Actinobacteria bacterium]|nr:zinc-ribbon domain-containing protein [Actinomycetota bacterium]